MDALPPVDGSDASSVALSQRSDRNRFAHPLHSLFAKTLAKVDHQRGVERTSMRKLFAANEELQIGVFPDRFDRFAIGQAQSLFDQQRAQGRPRGNDRRAEIFAQLSMINLLSQPPRHQPGQRDPAIVWIEMATEGKIKVGKLPLLTILAAVHPVTLVD